MKRFVALAGSVGLMLTSAAAADLPVFEPVPEAILAPVSYDWSGFYLGVHGGYGWGDPDPELTIESDPALNPPCGECIATLIDREGSLDGFLGGAQIGYNAQLDRFVVGIEGDASWSGIDGDEFVATTLPAGVGGIGSRAVDFESQASADVNWLATIRGRAGIALDRVLVFATGGAAVAEVESNYTISITGGTQPSGLPLPIVGRTFGFGDDKTLAAWTVGGGLEFAATQHVTIKAEYLFMDFDDIDSAAVDTENGSLSPFSYDAHTDVLLHTAKLGVNWKF